MENLIEEERKRQFMQHEEIQHLKSENQELVRASRKVSEANMDDSKQYGRDSYPRPQFGGMPFTTMPKKSPMPVFNNMNIETTGFKPMSKQSMNIEDRLRDITSELDQLDPNRKKKNN